jgi:hypothetical protein
VALTAVDLDVRSRKRKPGEIVVKALFIKAHHVKVSPVMLAMTFKAILSAHLSGHMISATRIDERFDVCVTSKAFIIRNFVTECVTLRTIRHPLEIGMRPGEIARRDLCR